MTIEQIIQLTQAGFTAEQVTALAPLISQPAQQTPAQQTPAQQTPAQQTPPAQQTQPAQQTDNSAIMAQLAALTAAIQNNNIVNSNNPATERTMFDVAAAIINP